MIAHLPLLSALLGQAEAAEVPMSGRGHTSNPVWSADGSKLAFEVNDYAGKIDLFTVKVEGGEPQGSPKLVKLNVAMSSFGGPTGMVAGAPIWHPSAPLLFFEASYTGAASRIYMTNLSSPPRQLIPEAKVGGDLSWPSLSADGDKLLFCSDATGGGDVYSFEIRGQNIGRLTESSHSEMAPRMHSSGKMAYTRKKGGGEDLFVLEAGADTAWAGGNGDQSRPIWADESILFFSNERGGDQWDIVAVDRPNAKRVLARNVRLPFRSPPMLSPDGKWVAYGLVESSESGHIWFAAVDGSKTVSVDTGLVACGEPSLVTSNGKTLLAFTALPAEGSDWRRLHIIDVSSVLR
jgi:Tol biopolymer transport system component